MSIVVPADFTGNEITIANADDQYNGVKETVQSCIDEYEPELLKQLFGSVLYADYLAGLAIDPIPQKWVDLRDNADLKIAITRYVYYYWTQTSNTYSSGTGTSKPKSENAVAVSSWDTMVKAWNKMVKANFGVRKFITEGGYETNFTDMPFWAWEFPFVNCERPEIFMRKNTLNL